MDMSQGSDVQAGANLAPQLPWASIPKFTPGVTNVQEYTQKLKFLAAMWPSESLPLLAPRAALLVEGTAFRKIARLDPAKLKTSTTAGVALLVEAIGGSWGSTEIEERYEYFEKALYGTVQKPDESHDSFLARMENNFVELISRNTTLEEVQAYVLLRQSTLQADDKKRILLEHQGDLKYKPVVKAFRLLGSKFFNEFQSGKTASKTKVYDVNFTEEHDSTSSVSQVADSALAFQASVEEVDGEIDGEFLEAMMANEDPDAMLVSSFETELEEFMQDVPGMCEAMTSYVEARAKLLEKKKGRGFWPKGGGKSKFGKGRGRGGKGKSARDRENLLARIARSHCRNCGQLGHWKAECPTKNQPSDSSRAASANVVTVAETSDSFQQAFVMPETSSEAIEVFSEAEDDVHTPPEDGFHCVSCTQDVKLFPDFSESSHDNPNVFTSQICEEAYVVRELLDRSHHNKLIDRMQQFRKNNVQRFPNCAHVCQDQQDLSSSCSVPRSRARLLMADHPALRVFRRWKDSECLPHECLAASCDKPCHAILDTGASRCIIGEKVLEQLRQHLPPEINSQVKQVPSSVTFRFGNNQSLTSSYRIQIPLLRQDNTPRKLWLAIEVVPGSTPFLFSKKAFKQLGGILDTTKDQCILQRLNRVFSLEHSKTDLYLLDITKLCSPDSQFSEVFQASHVGYVKTSWGNKDVLTGKEHDKIPMESPKRMFHFPRVSKLTAFHVRQPVSSRGKFVTDSTAFVQFSRNASKSDVDQSEECFRVHDRTADSSSSSIGSSTGVSATPRGQRGNAECRGHSDHEHYASGAAKSETSSAKLGGQSDVSRCCASTGSTDRSINGGDKPICTSPKQGSSTRSIQCSSSKCERNIGQSSSARSSFAYSRQSQPINVDSGRGGRGDRGDEHPRDFSDATSSEQHSSYSTASNSPSFSGRLGKCLHHVGQKAQRKDLSRGLPHGQRVLPLVIGEVPEFATQPAGLCALLSSSPGAGSTELSGNAVDCSSTFPKGMPEFSFHKEVQKIRDQLNDKSLHPEVPSDVSQSFVAAEGLIEQVFHSPKLSCPKSQIKLLEVYAGSHSPLVDAVRSLGFQAVRFTKDDGDLSTLSGRRKLWELIDRLQPENIWVAPECRPWGGWARLNQFKSVKLFDQISKDQYEQLQHVKLCASLEKYQRSRGRSFHLEQPLGSRMPNLSEFQSIRDNTQIVHVDMCAFGLKILGTQRYLKKSSQIFSSCSSVLSDLTGSRCPNDHEHQTIEGSLNFQGQRMSVTQFCASYCKGFAKCVAKTMCRNSETVLVNEHEEAPPAKKIRVSTTSQKRLRANPDNPVDPEDLATESNDKPEESLPEFPEAEDPNPASGISQLESVAPALEPSPSTEQWREAFRLADLAAPRVGNVKIPEDSPLMGIIQSLVPNIQVNDVFVCRGTERFQVPVNLRSFEQSPIRHTVCLHRSDNTIHDLGTENWVNLKRLQRIRSSIPSKLCITTFGHLFVQERSSLEQVQPPDSGPSQEVEPLVPLIQPDIAPSRSVGSSDVCEGWGPPPIPLHGPNFRGLKDTEKSDLIKLHKNLGHPDPRVLSEHLLAQKAPQRIVEAAKDFVCDACVESTGRRHQRPAKLHESRDFNDCVGIDGFFWRGHTGFQVHVLHCIDEASLFHLGKRIPTRNPDQIISSWSDFWTVWAGSPKILYADPAGEFRSQRWKGFLQSRNIQFDLTTEAWQRGRVERHGGIIKEMLNRFDQESPILSIEEFDQVLIACFQAKNALSRHQGYSPEQIVLGKSTHLPASLTSDEQAGAHSFADGDTPESEQFRRHLDIRSQARKTFLLVDNNQAIRRAFLRRSCPLRGPYEVGHSVMYWVRTPKVSRLGGGRWHGPAKVVCVESPSALWISHADRLFKVAPESVRPASLREWNQMTLIRQPSPAVHDAMQPAERSELISPPPAEAVPPEALEAPQVSPGYAPTTPQSVSPQSTMQPEIEATPAIDVPIPDTPLNTPALDPSGAPQLGEEPDLSPLDVDDSLIASSNILSCFHVQHSEEGSEPLLEVSTIEPGSTECSILLAEDELPFVTDPIVCHEEQCFVLEVPMSEHDIQSWWASDKPEAFAQVASASKRARAEVQLKTLTLEDRILFEKAKDAELSCWIQTNALRPILRKHLNPNQILKSRWVLTWKAIDDPAPEQSNRKAKARLVVLGFQDPIN